MRGSDDQANGKVLGASGNFSFSRVVCFELSDGRKVQFCDVWCGDLVLKDWFPD